MFKPQGILDNLSGIYLCRACAGIISNVIGVQGCISNLPWKEP